MNLMDNISYLRERPLAVIGLGNGILGDDAVGLKVVSMLSDEDLGKVADRYLLEFGGIRLLPYMAGYKYALIVDSYFTVDMEEGKFFWADLEDIKVGNRAVGTHDLSLPDAVRVARENGLPLPKKIEVMAVAVRDVLTIKEGLSKELKDNLDEIATALKRKIKEISIFLEEADKRA